MRVFGGERIKSLMGTFGIPEEQPIENGMITKQLESAQSRIEGFHFDARKQVLAYDDILNQQRHVVYERRRKLLLGEGDEVTQIQVELIESIPSLQDIIAKKESEFGKEPWYELMRKLALQMTDMLWVEHLEVMQYTRSSVNLRAYGQRDPLIEYRKEGLRLFNEMQAAVLHRMAEIIPNVQPETLAREEAELKEERAQIQTNLNDKQVAKKSDPIIKEQSYGRNDLVLVSNGSQTVEMKFKKAEPLLQKGEWKLVDRT